jgi:hypothetical protein
VACSPRPYSGCVGQDALLRPTGCRRLRASSARPTHIWYRFLSVRSSYVTYAPSPSSKTWGFSLCRSPTGILMIVMLCMSTIWYVALPGPLWIAHAAYSKTSTMPAIIFPYRHPTPQYAATRRRLRQPPPPSTYADHRSHPPTPTTAAPCPSATTYNTSGAGRRCSCRAHPPSGSALFLT